MGKLEEKNRKIVKKENLRKLILETVSIAGVLSIALVAPNVLVAMKKLGIIPKRRYREYVSSSASKLVKRGLMFFDGQTYRLTKKGKDILWRFQFSDYSLQKPKKWDGKWRLIIFDIPEKKKKIRNTLRYLFDRAGILRLQNSVWVYPYDCEEILTIIKTNLGVGRDVLYLIVDQIENDKRLREEFDLI